MDGLLAATLQVKPQEAIDQSHAVGDANRR